MQRLKDSSSTGGLAAGTVEAEVLRVEDGMGYGGSSSMGGSGKGLARVCTGVGTHNKPRTKLSKGALRSQRGAGSSRPLKRHQDKEGGFCTGWKGGIARAQGLMSTWLQSARPNPQGPNQDSLGPGPGSGSLRKGVGFTVGMEERAAYSSGDCTGNEE